LEALQHTQKTARPQLDATRLALRFSAAQARRQRATSSANALQRLGVTQEQSNARRRSELCSLLPAKAHLTAQLGPARKQLEALLTQLASEQATVLRQLHVALPLRSSAVETRLCGLLLSTSSPDGPAACGYLTHLLPLVALAFGAPLLCECVFRASRSLAGGFDATSAGGFSLLCRTAASLSACARLPVDSALTDPLALLAHALSTLSGRKDDGTLQQAEAGWTILA